MRFIENPARTVTQFGSRGLTARHLVRGEDLAVTVLRVEADGEIGRHPATVDQLFIVVAGRGAVCGGDGRWQPIASGEAVLWTAGEPHTTRADEALVAVVVEMASLADAVS